MNPQIQAVTLIMQEAAPFTSFDLSVDMGDGDGPIQIHPTGKENTILLTVAPDGRVSASGQAGHGLDSDDLAEYIRMTLQFYEDVLAEGRP